MAKVKVNYKIAFYTLIFLGAFSSIIIFFSVPGAHEKVYVKSSVLFVSAPKDLVEKGNRYFDEASEGTYNIVKAELFFKEALKRDPFVLDAHHQLARIYFLKGDFDNARKEINQQINIHGEDLMASYYIRGLIEGYAGNYDEGIKDMAYFLEWDKENWAAHNDLSWLYFQKGDFENAKKVADGGLRFAPYNPWLLTMAGVSRISLNRDLDEADELLKRAKAYASRLDSEDWNYAYPGNDPAISERGLFEMQTAIDKNLALIEEKSSVEK